MRKTPKVTTAADVDREVTVHINVPKGSKLPFKVDGLKVGGQHSMTLHGEVRSVNEDEYGKGMGMKVHGIDMADIKPSSLGDEFKKVKKGRTQPLNDVDEDD